MPTLNWIGRKAVENHHRQVPFHLLKDVPDNIEKRQLGELWERRSEGKGLFIMPRGKDWAAIRAKTERA